MKELIEHTTNQLLHLLLSVKRSSEDCAGATCTRHPQPRQTISAAVAAEKPLTLILPAFPAKSANRQKTLSAMPDRGEIMGLSYLNQLCHDMTALYKPGVQLIICSDGRVFNDLVLVSDEDVNLYQQGIRDIICNNQLSHLSTFSLDEVFQVQDYSLMRELLLLQFGQSISELKADMLRDPALRYQFNGIHRFVFEDQLALRPGRSKNSVRQSAKEIAYEVMRRSNAWSRLLLREFPSTVRLSIHPQPCDSEKLGIHFLPTTNQWATPWHNVLLRNAQGWQLMKRAEAERLGGTLMHDHYVLEA